jgi:hypothetical protein
VHLVDYFRRGELNPSQNQPTGAKDKPWSVAGDPTQLWTAAELTGLRKQIEAAGLKLEAIENLYPTHWYDILLDDHTPQMNCSAPWHVGMAHTLGFLRAAIDGAGSLGRNVETIDDLCRLLHPVVQPWNVFKQRAGRVGEAEMLVDLAHVANVRANREAVAVGNVGHLPELGDTSQTDHVGLDVMHRAGVDEVVELRGHVKLLAESGGGSDGFYQVAMAFDIVELDGLLDPDNIEVDETTGGLDGLRKGLAAIGGGHDADIGAERGRFRIPASSISQNRPLRGGTFILGSTHQDQGALGEGRVDEQRDAGQSEPGVDVMQKQEGSQGPEFVGQEQKTPEAKELGAGRGSAEKHDAQRKGADRDQNGGGGQQQSENPGGLRQGREQVPDFGEVGERAHVKGHVHGLEQDEQGQDDAVRGVGKLLGACEDVFFFFFWFWSRWFRSRRHVG